MDRNSLLQKSDRIVVRIGVSTEESHIPALSEDNLAQAAQFLHFGDHIEGIEDGMVVQPTEEGMQGEENVPQDENSSSRLVFSNMERQMEAVDGFEEILAESQAINPQHEVATPMPPVSIRIFTRTRTQLSSSQSDMKGMSRVNQQECTNQKEPHEGPLKQVCSGNDPLQSEELPEETNTSNLMYGNILQQALNNENIQGWEEKCVDEIPSARKTSAFMECKKCHVCFIQQHVYLAHVSSCSGNIKESFRCVHCQTTFPTKKAVVQHQLLCKKASNIVIRTKISSSHNIGSLQKTDKLGSSDSGNSFTKRMKIMPRKSSNKGNDSDEDEEDDEDFNSETDEEAFENEQVQYDDDDDDDDILFRDMHQNDDIDDDEYEIDLERKTNKHLGPVLVGGKFKCRDCDRTFSKESQYKRHINACTNAPLNASRIDMDFLTPSEVSKAQAKPEVNVKEKKKRGRPRKNPLSSESLVLQTRKNTETFPKKNAKTLWQKDTDALQDKVADFHHEKNAETLQEKNTETLQKKNAETFQEENAETLLEKNAETPLEKNAVIHQEKNTETLQEKNAETLQEKSAGTLQEKNAETRQKNAVTRQEKNAKTLQEKNAEALQEKNAEALQKKNAEALQEKNTEALQEKNAEALKEKNAEALKEKSGEALQEKNAEALQEKNAEALQEKNVGVLQEKNAEMLQEKNKETVHEINAGPLQNIDADTHQKNKTKVFIEKNADTHLVKNADTLQEKAVETLQENAVNMIRKKTSDTFQEKELGETHEKNQGALVEENIRTHQEKNVGILQENNAKTLQEEQDADIFEVEESDAERDDTKDSSVDSNQDNSVKKEIKVVKVKEEVRERSEVLGHRCSLCLLKFETSDGMVNHMKEVHCQDVCNMYNLVRGKTSLTSSSCPLCPQFYCTPDLLLLHLVIAHKDRLQQAYETAEDQYEALPCPWCKYIAHAREFLLEHLALNHLQEISPDQNMDDSGEKIYSTKKNDARKRKTEVLDFSTDEGESHYIKKRAKRGRTKMRRQSPHNVFLLKRKHSKDEEVTCPDCDAKFQKINFLVRHKAMGACERALNNQTTKSFHCNEPGCNGRAFYKVVHLFAHQAEVHGRKIPCRKLTFDSLDDCMEWMSSEEKKFNVRYISTYKRITKGKLSSTWVCHRFHSAQFDRRQEKRDDPPSRRWYVKIQRSSNCLARLIMAVSYNRLTKKYDGQTAVTYFHQHSHTEVDHPPEIASRVLERHARDKKVFFVKGVPRKYERPFGPHLPPVSTSQDITRESKKVSTGNKDSELDLVSYEEGNLEHVIEETVVDGQLEQINSKNPVASEEVHNYVLQESLQEKQQQFWIEEVEVPCDNDNDSGAAMNRGGITNCHKIIIGDKAYVVMDKDILAVVDSNYVPLNHGGDDMSTIDPLVDKVETEMEGGEDEDIYMLPANLEEWNKMFDTVRCKLENGELTEEEAKEVEEMLQSQNVVSLLPVVDQVAIFSKICQIGNIQMTQLSK